MCGRLPIVKHLSLMCGGLASVKHVGHIWLRIELCCMKQVLLAPLGSLCRSLPVQSRHIPSRATLFVCCLSSDIVASDGSAVDFPFSTLIKSRKNPHKTSWTKAVIEQSAMKCSYRHRMLDAQFLQHVYLFVQICNNFVQICNNC